jgi:hypothetical protein
MKMEQTVFRNVRTENTEPKNHPKDRIKQEFFYSVLIVIF